MEAKATAQRYAIPARCQASDCKTSSANIEMLKNCMCRSSISWKFRFPLVISQTVFARNYASGTHRVSGISTHLSYHPNLCPQELFFLHYCGRGRNLKSTFSHKTLQL